MAFTLSPVSTRVNEGPSEEWLAPSLIGERRHCVQNPPPLICYVEKLCHKQRCTGLRRGNPVLYFFPVSSPPSPPLPSPPLPSQHHCRKCGSVVCGSCSTQRFLLPQISSKPLRVCDRCYDKLSATQAPKEE